MSVGTEIVEILCPAASMPSSQSAAAIRWAPFAAPDATWVAEYSEMAAVNAV
jgi:hypothetical protein